MTPILFNTVAVLLALLCVAPAAAGNLPKDPSHYAIGMDCGSSGSRVCIYSFDKDPSDLVPVGTECLNVHPGLSSYADAPWKAGESMKPLFDHAISMGVPTGAKVYLAATAGLRALPDPAVVDQIMASVRDYLNNNYSPHLVWAESYPRVLSGNEEGVFGWAAVNHMMGRLGQGPEQSVGTLDMGGSSTQITFVPKDPSDVPPGYQYQWPWKGQVYNLYTHSFAGYGYNDARKAMLLENNVEDWTGMMPGSGLDNPTVLIDPCALSGYRSEQEVGDQNVTVAGTGSWGGCTDRCKMLLAKHWPCVSVEAGVPVISGGTRRGGYIAPCLTVADGDKRVLFTDPLAEQFMALSNFADIESALGLPMEASVGEVLQKGRELCSTRWSDLKKKHSDLDQDTLSTYCFGASYIYEVLHEGYHFPSTMKLTFTKHLDVGGQHHVKISWTRGMILYELTAKKSAAEHTLLGFADTISSSGDSSSYMGGFLLLGLVGAAVIAAAGFAVVRGTAELKEVVSTGVHKGMDKLSEGKAMASSAASKGKKIVVSSLPEHLPFKVPFARSYNGYEDVEGDTSAGDSKRPLSTRQALRGSSGYGTINDGESTGADEALSSSGGSRMTFGKLFPQLQEAGKNLIMRGTTSDVALSHLISTNSPNCKSEEAEETETCMVCEGRRKMGVEGSCGLCKTRESDDYDKC